MLKRLSLAAALAAGLFSHAHSAGLTSRGATTVGTCYASGASGMLVPCALQGGAWQRLTMPGDDAAFNSVTVAGPIQGSSLLGDLTAASLAPTGAVSTPRTISSLFGDVWSKLFWTTYGDAVSTTASATIAAGSKTLTVATPLFSSASVNARIGVGLAGAALAGSYITSLPVTSPGSGVTTPPTLTITDSGTTPGSSGTLIAAMSLASATIQSGGAGCTNGTQTFTLSGGSLWEDPRRFWAQVTGTVTNGVLSGALTISNPGSYWSNGQPAAGWAPGTSGVTLTGGGCTTAPTISASYNIGAVIPVGRGWMYNPATTTVTASGGVASTSPTFGTPTFTPIVQTLDTVITSVQSSTQVTLRDAAATSISAATVPVVFGHDDTAAIQAEITRKGSVYIPYSASGCYLVDRLAVPSNRVIWGNGACLKSIPVSYNAMFDLGTSGNVEIYGLEPIGNKDTMPHKATGNVGILSAPGSSNITLHDLTPHDFGRHLVMLDGVATAREYNIRGWGTQWGGGLYASSTTCSTDVKINFVNIRDTQLANIGNFVGITGWGVSNFTARGSGKGSGSQDAEEIADNVTGYTGNACANDYRISNGDLWFSANHGAHLGADNIDAANLHIFYPNQMGVFGAKAPNTQPTQMLNFQSNDVSVVNYGRNDSQWIGQSIRNTIGGQIGGLKCTNLYDCIELRGIGQATVNINVTKVLTNNVTYCFRFTKGVSYSRVGDSICGYAAIGASLENTGDAFPSRPPFNNTFTNITFSGVTGAMINEAAGNANIGTGLYAVNGSAGTINQVGALSSFEKADGPRKSPLITTVSGLPTCSAANRGAAVVTDATAPTYRGALTGGGTVETPVYCDGTSWTSR